MRTQATTRNRFETVIPTQSNTDSMDGRKFFDFGFGNATAYYDIIDRPVPDHPRNGSVSDGEFCRLSSQQLLHVPRGGLLELDLGSRGRSSFGSNTGRPSYFGKTGSSIASFVGVLHSQCFPRARHSDGILSRGHLKSTHVFTPRGRPTMMA